MATTEFDEQQYLTLLQEAYALSRSIYKMSFRERLQFEFGMVHISTRATDEIKAMSREELEKALAEIKKPWWNWVFRIIKLKG